MARSGVDYWNFIAPDITEFRAYWRDRLPPLVRVGPFSISKDTVIDTAWLFPGSSHGLALNVYYLLDRQGRAAQDATNAGLQDAALNISDRGTLGRWATVDGMAALVIPNIYRCSVEGLSGGRAVVNVFGLRGTGPGLSTSAVTALQTAWKVALGPLSQLQSLYTLVQFRALDLSSVNGGIAVIGDATAGGVTVGSISTNAAAALVKWNGGTRSRSSRGRCYFGPLSEASINADGRTLVPANQTAIATAFTNFRASLSSGGFTLCVISPTTASAFDVTTQQVTSVIATQRRRIRS